MYVLKNYKDFINEKSQLNKFDLNSKEQSMMMLINEGDIQHEDEVIFERIARRLYSRLDKRTKNDIDLYLESYNLSFKHFLVESSVFDLIIEAEEGEDKSKGGFFSKLKKNFDKAREVSNIIKDKGEEALGKLIQKAKDAVSFIKGFLGKIKDFFTNMIEKVKNSKIVKKIEEEVKKLSEKDKKGGIVKDVKTGREVVKWYRSDFLSQILGQAKGSMSKFLSKDQKPVDDKEALAESFQLNEGGNVIATMVHGLEKIPPFSWLHKVAQAGEAGANKLISAMSKVTDKLGGPSFELPVIAGVIGIGIEYVTKGLVKSPLVSLVGGATTPLGMAIYGLAYIATAIALIMVVDNLIGDKIGVAGSDDHSDGDVEEKVEEQEDNKE